MASLLEAMIDTRVGQLVFSSSAATYGTPDVEVVDEAIYRGEDLTPQPGDGLFLVPDGEVSGAVVRQARDGWDSEAQAAAEQARFAAFLAVEREDYLAALAAHLGHTAGYLLHHLRGQTVLLRVDAAGRPQLTPVPAA